MSLPFDNSQCCDADPRQQLRSVLRQLLQSTSPQNVTGLLAQLDALIPWARDADERLAHYLERRSYQKALAHLDPEGTA